MNRQRWIVAGFCVTSVLLAALWLLREQSTGSPLELRTLPRASSASTTQPVELEQLPASNVEGALKSRSEAAPAESASDECLGVLSVRCRDARSAAPLSGVRVQIRLVAQADKDGSVRVESAPSAVTDAEGRCEITLPCASSLALSAIPAKKTYLGVARELAPLQRGERRELLLEFGADPTIAMCVRIVDRASGAAIEGATIERASEEGVALKSDADGRCTLQFLLSQARALDFDTPKRLPVGFCRVHAKGFGLAEFQECEGHESADKALVVSLDRTASLAVSLVRRTDSAAGAFELRANLLALELVQNALPAGSIDMQPLVFSSACDAAGVVLLEGLPANVPLTVAVHQGAKAVRTLPEPLRLAPGERRGLEIDLGLACRLSGRVIDAAGAGVAELEIWLAPQGEYPTTQFASWNEKEVVSKARSDATGRFDLAEVPAGRYALGPADNELQRGQPGSLASVAARNLALEIGADESPKDVLLRVDRSLYLRGVVLRPDGTPLSGTGQIFATTQPRFSKSTFSKSDGSFTIGPLVASRYELVASGGGFAESLPIEADAGASGIVLTLCEAAKLSGRVVEIAGGHGVRATMRLSMIDGDGRIGMQVTDEQGAFRYTAMTPGRYGLVAATPDGRVGVLPALYLAPGADLHDVELLLAPGARLSVRFEGDDTALWVHVFQDGANAAGIPSPSPDGTFKTNVPAGELTVKLRLKDSRRELEQTLRVSAGEEREVVFKQGQ